MVGPLGYDPRSRSLRGWYDKSIFTMDPKFLPDSGQPVMPTSKEGTAEFEEEVSPKICPC